MWCFLQLVLGKTPSFIGTGDRNENWSVSTVLASQILAKSQYWTLPKINYLHKTNVASWFWIVNMYIISKRLIRGTKCQTCQLSFLNEESASDLTASLVVLADLHLWSCSHTLLFGKKTGAKTWQWHTDKIGASWAKTSWKNPARIFPLTTRATDRYDVSDRGNKGMKPYWETGSRS